MPGKLIQALSNIKIKQLSIKFESCTLCGFKLQVKTHNDEMGIRCIRCFATPVTQSLAAVFKQYLKPDICVYELSSRGAFVRFLQKQKINLTLSEYFDTVQPGDFKQGVQCQNVEKLTFKDNSFDICTSLEVFEHVEDDIKGFKQICRVLKPKGAFIFTVPISLNSNTIERTQIINGQRENILPPEYHSDTLRGSNRVFCFRNYGKDITNRLIMAGFQHAEIIEPDENTLFGLARPVIIAGK